MKQYDPRIDEYIDKKPAFAQPILKHIRDLVHAASPLITENIKWGHPFFEYKGALANMAAFKAHCAFGFWKGSLLKDPGGFINKGNEPSAGSFGRIASLSDLPPDDVLIDFVLQAFTLNETGAKGNMKKAVTTPKAPIPEPDYFIAALKADPKANAAFHDFSPSCKREYLEWITEAKSEPTRLKRMETALEWMAEGKTRNWKYK